MKWHVRDQAFNRASVCESTVGSQQRFRRNDSLLVSVDFADQDEIFQLRDGNGSRSSSFSHYIRAKLVLRASSSLKHTME